MAKVPRVGDSARAADQQRIANGVERRARAFGKTDAQSIGSAVGNNGHSRRFASNERASVEFGLLRGEAGAGGYALVDGERDGGSADGVFNAVS